MEQAVRLLLMICLGSMVRPTTPRDTSSSRPTRRPLSVNRKVATGRTGGFSLHATTTLERSSDRTSRARPASPRSDDPHEGDGHHLYRGDGVVDPLLIVAEAYKPEAAQESDALQQVGAPIIAITLSNESAMVRSRVVWLSHRRRSCPSTIT